MPDEPNQPEAGPQPDTGLQAALWHAGNDWNTAWQRRHAEPPDVLYHYTDAGGLRGILQSSTLWASNAAYLNDATELVYVKEILAAAVEELESEYETPIVRDFLQLLTKAFDTVVLNMYDVFVVCFCEQDDLLSQWRGYPPSGGGYSIGFRTEVIFESRMISRVVYDLENQRKILRSLLVPTCQLLASGDTETSPEYLSQAKRLAVEMTTPNLAFCSFAFKHPGFAEEREWRLVRVMVRGAEPPAGGTPLFRERGHGLLPYTVLDLEQVRDGEKPIATVTVGPTVHPELTSSATGQLLQSLGYDVSEMVEASKIPLRI
jgi:hypothetical protein